MIYYVRTTYFGTDMQPEDTWLGSNYKDARERFENIAKSSLTDSERISHHGLNIIKVHQNIHSFAIRQYYFVMKLTDKETGNYVNGICPNCGDTNVETHGNIFFDDSTVYEFQCQKCEFEFKENYSVKFEGIEA